MRFTSIVTFFLLAPCVASTAFGAYISEVLVANDPGYNAATIVDPLLLNPGGPQGPSAVALAPDNFGDFSGAIIAANLGDGSLAAYDPTSDEFLGFLLDPDGDPIQIGGLWGITFDAGDSLGASNVLYFAAGPITGPDGQFGAVRYSEFGVPEPSTFALAAVAIVAGALYRRRWAHKQQ